MPSYEITERDMLDDLQVCRHDLSEWEHDFVESVRDQWEDRGWLSEKQQETLYRIWKERT